MLHDDALSSVCSSETKQETGVSGGGVVSDVAHSGGSGGAARCDASTRVISSRRTLRTVDSTMEECARALAASPYPTVRQKVAHLFDDDSAFNGSALHDDSALHGNHTADTTMLPVRKDQEATDTHVPVMAAVSAEVQTHGTGRLNRQWVDREGESLSVSYVVAMPKTVLETLGSGWLTAAIGIAAVDSLREVVAAAQLPALPALPALPELALKWPNDLFFRGRKLGGILTRAIEADADTVAVIVGIGMNLGMEERDLPLPQAISLRMVVEQQRETHDAVTQGLQHETLAKKDIFSDYETLRDMVIEKIAGELAVWFRKASEEPQEVRSALHRRVVSLSATVGQRVTVHLVDGTTYSGTAVGIDFSAALLIQCDDGERRRVTAGDVGIDVGGVR